MRPQKQLKTQKVADHQKQNKVQHADVTEEERGGKEDVIKNDLLLEQEKEEEKESGGEKHTNQ